MNEEFSLLNFIYIYSEEIKDILVAIQSFIVSVGVIVGGIWTYRLFIRNRQKYPRSNLSHNILHKCLPDGQIFLRVETEIQNSGDVLISLLSGETRTQQILPISDDTVKDINDFKLKNDKKEIEWPSISEKEIKWDKGKCEIEPGEKDQICFDFIIDSNVTDLLVYSFFKNIKKQKNLGWGITTIYNIKEY